MKQAAALCLLLMPGAAMAQQQQATPESLPVRVTDLRGTPIWQAHVYVREILPAPNDTMHLVGDTDRNGTLMVPGDVFARDLLVFDYGFQPWTGPVRGGFAGPVLVHMRRAPCNSPDGGCHNDEDALGPLRRKHR